MKNSDRSLFARGVLVALMGSCLLMLSCSPTPSGNSEEGKRWFGLHRCDGCHGENGAGGGAPDIRQVGLSHRNLLSKIRNSKSSIMPSYAAKDLSDQHVADIFSYLEEK